MTKSEFGEIARMCAYYSSGFELMNVEDGKAFRIDIIAQTINVNAIVKINAKSKVIGTLTIMLDDNFLESTKKVNELRVKLIKF